MADRIPFDGVSPGDPMNRRIAVIVLDQRTAAAIMQQSTFVLAPDEATETAPAAAEPAASAVPASPQPSIETTLKPE
ncbi:flagellar motor protein MotB [compost metagenome]